MKTQLLFALSLLCAVSSLAQSEEPLHTVSTQIGYGWFGLFENTTADITISDNNNGITKEYTATFNGTPATTLAYDYRFGRTFSLGGAVGFQSMDLTDFRDAATNENISGAVGINRFFFSVRTLFHYGNNPKWDLYSGVRVGATHWNVNSTLDEDEFSFGEGINVSRGSFVLPHLVPIPFGVKHYPTERFMIGAELAVGSPHVLALQAGFRF